MKFSIITPVYNREDCIARCIESVIQNIKNNRIYDVEHIIVDDGSDDNTANIIFQYELKYHHIRFIKFKNNRGTNAARNAGIQAATGNYCIILDSDDYFVYNALEKIYSTISKTTYQHYLFASNDMQPKYAENNILSQYNQIELTWKMFLLGKISGDFIHVIDTQILKKYPFDESLRIYEGVFFMRFYKEAQKILFTNTIIVIRERGRSDSATRESFRTSKIAIKRNIKAYNILLEWFKNDYEKDIAGKKCLIGYYLILLDNNLLLGNYSKSKDIVNTLKSYYQYQVPTKYKIIYNLKLGYFYAFILKLYLILKYKIFNRKLK